MKNITAAKVLATVMLALSLATLSFAQNYEIREPTTNHSIVYLANAACGKNKFEVLIKDDVIRLRLLNVTASTLNQKRAVRNSELSFYRVSAACDLRGNISGNVWSFGFARSNGTIVREYRTARFMSNGPSLTVKPFRDESEADFMSMNVDPQRR